MTDLDGRRAYLARLVERDWLRVAAFAWREHLEAGPGVVLVEPGQPHLLEYATPYDGVDFAVVYDPRRQVLLGTPSEGELVLPERGILRVETAAYLWNVGEGDPPPPAALGRFSQPTAAPAT